MTKTTLTTCTIRLGADGTVCGRTDIVYREGEFAECAKHALEAGSLYSTRHMKGADYGARKVGDRVTVHRYGKAYEAVVTRVGKRGAIYATFHYGNGAERTVRV